MGRRIFCAPRPDQPPATSPPPTPTYTDMDFRKSFSKPFEKLKHRLTEGNRKPDGRSGREDNGEGRETDVEVTEASQMGSRLHSEVGDMVESRPGREETSNDVKGKKFDWVDSLISPPSISWHDGESGGTQTARCFDFCL